MASSNVYLWIPNLIGYLRIVLLSLALTCMAFHKPLYGAYFYMSSYLLDALDGFAARSLNQCTLHALHIFNFSVLSLGIRHVSHISLTLFRQSIRSCLGHGHRSFLRHLTNGLFNAASAPGQSACISFSIYLPKTG